MSHSLSYPIGEFEAPQTVTSEHLTAWIQDIQSFPFKVEEVVKDLTDEEKNWRYRPKGWSIKQVVHHCGDSHANALTRFKLALTEDAPTIRPYEEHLWAELHDSLDNDLTASLQLLHGLHHRWAILLKSLDATQLKRKLLHPDFTDPWPVDAYIGNYAWHCRHHLAHIQQALAAKGGYN